MTEPSIGDVVDTRRGRGTLLALTAMQARVQPHDGDDPYWILRTDITIIEQVDEPNEPTMLELLDNAQACIELVRAKMAPQQNEKEIDDEHA